MVSRLTKTIIAAALLSNSVFCTFLRAADEDRVYLNAQGSLRRSISGSLGETFSIMSQDNSRILVAGSGEQFVQIRYGENNHIMSKTVWKVTGGEATRESLEEYFYTPARIQPTRRVKRDFVAETQEETLFLPSGKESQITLYSLADDEKNDGAEKRSLISRTDLRYDTKNRVVEKTYMTKPSDEVETVEISRFTYTDRSKKPNTEVFRDGVLVHKTEYTAENNYTETLLFEGDFSAVVVFENGEKKQERFFFRGEEIKRNI